MDPSLLFDGFCDISFDFCTIYLKKFSYLFLKLSGLYLSKYIVQNVVDANTQR